MAFVGMIVGGIDILMLLSDWFLERCEKRIQTAREEGRKQGYAEGYAAAKAENGNPPASEASPAPTPPSDASQHPSKTS